MPAGRALKPATIMDKAVSIDVTEGDPATLQCKFSGTKNITAKWFKDGKELTLGPKYKISITDTVSVLKVLHTEKKDSGEYIFEVHNDVGSSSCSASINVLGVYGLSFIIGFTEILSSPEMRPTTTVAEFNTFVATLQLTNVDLSHRGRYTCQAKNESGTEKCFALLFVQGVYAPLSSSWRITWEVRPLLCS
uniref:Ig-like domain-containing protein n=1 Tax=Apteryx owenii TaxID=8824 RepID=A0A8B9S5T1_APTOW